MIDRLWCLDKAVAVDIEASACAGKFYNDRHITIKADGYNILPSLVWRMELKQKT